MRIDVLSAGDLRRAGGRGAGEQLSKQRFGPPVPFHPHLDDRLRLTMARPCHSHFFV
ncbi:hypothetical protein [Pararhodobacter sp. SW119]|uniref:hypothetical protein n=1 Tax=Pararhodobacter sp. SW119 TaxID=2780075 RepID=UPI001ADFDEB4|nr:hypothetical protein [Pararhodobacter sp. SW119]